MPYARRRRFAPNPRSTKAGASPKLKAWRASPRFKEIAARACARGRQIQKAKPRCGAKAKSTGMPCRQVALENGKCKFHGGRTPRGAGWHKIRMPDRGEKDGVEKFEAKLAAREKRDREKRRRLAMMTPAQRAAHEKWQAEHVPGPKSARAAAKAKKKQATWLRGVLEEVDAKRAPDAARRPATDVIDDFQNYREGVFG